MRKLSMKIVSFLCACAIGLVSINTPVMAAPRTIQSKTAGGWALVTENNPRMMNDNDMTRVTTVLQERGDDFEVLGLIATQVVSGTNYMYLVYGTPANEAIPGYYFVKVYQDTKGNSSITKITPIDVTNIQTGTAYYGWKP